MSNILSLAAVPCGAVIRESDHAPDWGETGAADCQHVTVRYRVLSSAVGTNGCNMEHVSAFQIQAQMG